MNNKPTLREEKLSEINLRLRMALSVAQRHFLHGDKKLASLILKNESDNALEKLAIYEKKHKIYCKCGRQLRFGKEIRNWQETGMCFDCDAGFSDFLAQVQKEEYARV